MEGGSESEGIILLVFVDILVCGHFHRGTPVDDQRKKPTSAMGDRLCREPFGLGKRGIHLFGDTMKHICQHQFTEDGKMVYPELSVSLETLKRNYDLLVGMIGEEHGFFRCGWCGQPTDPKGNVLDPVLIPDGTEEDWNGAKLVNGECCPHGDERCQSAMMTDSCVVGDKWVY